QGPPFVSEAGGGVYRGVRKERASHRLPQGTVTSLRFAQSVARTSVAGSAIRLLACQYSRINNLKLSRGLVGCGRRRGGRLTGPRRPRTTGSRDGFLFSGPGHLEGPGQVQRGFVQRQAMDRGPEIQHIPFECTIRLEALEDVLAEMDRERSLGGGGLAVYRARATTLPAMATQLREQAQMPKHLLHAHLMAQECEVHLGARSAFRPRRTL